MAFLKTHVRNWIYIALASELLKSCQATCDCYDNKHCDVTSGKKSLSRPNIRMPDVTSDPREGAPAITIEQKPVPGFLAPL